MWVTFYLKQDIRGWKLSIIFFRFMDLNGMLKMSTLNKVNKMNASMGTSAENDVKNDANGFQR